MIAEFVNSVPMPMLAVARDTRLLAANAPATSLLGSPVVGRPFVTSLRHPGINAALEWVLEPRGVAPLADPSLPEAPQGGQRLRAMIAGEGRDISCDVTIAPLPVALGGGALITIDDLTSVEAAEKMRRNFVANVSHELRTPLTALTGFIETLQGPAKDDPAARERFLEIMGNEAARMNRLVSDLLSLTHVEGQERTRPSQSIDIAALIRSVVATLAPQARSKSGVEITARHAEGEVMIPGDADQITQVLHNLIENGVKYGGSGGVVTVSLNYIAREPVLRGHGWAIEVADKGDGIDALHLPRLTERFYRIDNHRSREKGGTGLGLAIVKHIINRHRGRLRVESRPGEGAKFTVILPERHNRQ